MKKAKRKSKFWLMGGLAALIFLGSGSIAAAQVVTSYNDLASGTGQTTTNITTFTSPAGGSGFLNTGQLKDFDTGLDTAVTLAVTGGTYDGDANHATQGADPTTGDAFTIFDGKVNGVGAISYINLINDDLVLTFTNMDPNKVYDLAFFAHRNLYGWDRASLVTITGTALSNTSFVNTSSVAADNPDTGTYPGGVLFTGPTSPSTRLPADNDNGYVARFSNIKSGSDGTVVLTISFDGAVPSQYLGKYGSALRLIESGNTPNDTNGDGTADIVWRNTTDGSVATWLGNGVNAPTTTGINAGVPTTWTIVGIGDVNGDGTADLVWRDSNTGDVAVWLGSGVTAPTTTGIIAGALPAAWKIVGVGDVNGDGTGDIVLRNTSTGDVAVWLGNGVNPPTMTGVIVAGLPAEWQIVGVGDVNGDGTADIVLRNTSTGDVAVWLGNGVSAPTTTGVIVAGLPAAWVIAGVGDLNGDGTDDIVLRNTSTGDVAVWLGNGVSAPTTTGVIVAGLPAAWVIESVVDLNGDGTADIVLRNTSTGDVAVWLGNGVSAPTTTGVIASSVPLEWEIQP